MGWAFGSFRNLERGLDRAQRNLDDAQDSRYRKAQQKARQKPIHELDRDKLEDRPKMRSEGGHLSVRGHLIFNLVWMMLVVLLTKIAPRVFRDMDWVTPACLAGVYFLTYAAALILANRYRSRKLKLGTIVVALVGGLTLLFIGAEEAGILLVFVGVPIAVFLAILFFSVRALFGKPERSMRELIEDVRKKA